MNFADVMGRLGLYPDLPPRPVVPGYEISGKVDAVGAEVEPDWIGRDILALTRFGGYADTVCVPEVQLATRPPDMSAPQGAALPVNYLTAWQILEVMGGLRAGQIVLIHSAGGGVGIAALQLAKRVGARVIGTASTAKHDALKRFGLDFAIDPAPRTSRSACGSTRAAAASTWCSTPSAVPRSARATAVSRRPAGSRCSGCRRGAGQAPQLPAPSLTTARGCPGSTSPAAAHQRESRRLRREPRAPVGRDRTGERLARGAARLLAPREIAPLIGATFPLERAAEAHHFIQDRKNIGKVVLIP